MKTLREYMAELQSLIDKKPEILDFHVVYSKDDEGNEFNHVHYSPSLGHYKDGEFKDKGKHNSICLN